jgi:hypothetical protein
MMPRYSQREEELATFFLQGRQGNVLLGFYCGYSTEEVAHFLVSSTIRADKHVGAKVLDRIPYFAEWRTLRNKHPVAWPVVPTVKDFHEGLEAVRERIAAARMAEEDTSTLAGIENVAEAATHQRNDGYEYTTFHRDVIRDVVQLAERCGLRVTDRPGKLHGRPQTFRRLDFLNLLPENE